MQPQHPPMSTFFPHINLTALEEHASDAAWHEAMSIANNCQRTDDVVRLIFTQPKVTSMKDIVWAGENMILISFDPSTIVAGPTCMLAHFPRGRRGLMTGACVGMTTLASVLNVPVPKPYHFECDPNNDVGSDFVLLEKAPGESLDSLWDSLSNKQRKKICAQLAEILVNMFRCRTNGIYTHRMYHDPHSNDESAIVNDREFILAPAFDEGPLAYMDAANSTSEVGVYLDRLAQRIDRLFNSPNALSGEHLSKLGWLGKPHLNIEDITKIRATWARLRELIPYNSGGWYLPTSLSEQARARAKSVLQSRRSGLYHPDLQMSRIIVDFKDGKASLCIYGWEHAYCAPLWSCARMPTWIQPKFPQLNRLPITPDQQIQMSRHIYSTIRGLQVEGSLDWIIAYTFGETERFVEGCLSAHWMWSDTIEAGLHWIDARWQEAHPHTRFPIDLTSRRVFESPIEDQAEDTEDTDDSYETPGGRLGPPSDTAQAMLAKRDCWSSLSKEVSLRPIKALPKRANAAVKAEPNLLMC